MKTAEKFLIKKNYPLYNNFGGLMNGGGSLRKFRSPEIGAIYHIESIIRIIGISQQKNTYDVDKPLEDNLFPYYCPEDSWPGKVKSLKKEVYGDYNLEDYVSSKGMVRTN